MEKHPYQTLSVENGAKLLFTPCPGTKDESLTDSIATLKQAGAQAVVTLFFDKEIAANDVQALPDVCKDAGIDWYQLPITDDCAPDDVFEKAWQQHKKALVDVINKQGTLAVHCKGGTGRTGLVIALLLAEFGWDKDKVISEIHKVKEKSMRIPLQVDYFKAY